MEFLIYQLIRVPVISVRYFCLIKDVQCNFVWFTNKIQCAFHHKVFLAKVLPNLWQRHLEKTLLLPALVSNAPVSACYQITYLYYLHSGARIIRTKIRENFVRIKQNVRIIHTKKSVGKHTVV